MNLNFKFLGKHYFLFPANWLQLYCESNKNMETLFLIKLLVK